jgi:ABC-type amino acid transport substrate-binding protein
VPDGPIVQRNDAAFRLAVNRAIADLYRSRRVPSLFDRWFGAFGERSLALQATDLLDGLPE